MDRRPETRRPDVSQSPQGLLRAAAARGQRAARRSRPAAVGGPRRDVADLEDALRERGLTQYARKFVHDQGFTSVAALLRLRPAKLEAVIDAIRPMPGHRVRILNVIEEFRATGPPYTRGGPAPPATARAATGRASRPPSAPTSRVPFSPPSARPVAGAPVELASVLPPVELLDEEAALAFLRRSWAVEMLQQMGEQSGMGAAADALAAAAAAAAAAPPPARRPPPRKAALPPRKAPLPPKKEWRRRRCRRRSRRRAPRCARCRRRRSRRRRGRREEAAAAGGGAASLWQAAERAAAADGRGGVADAAATDAAATDAAADAARGGGGGVASQRRVDGGERRRRRDGGRRAAQSGGGSCSEPRRDGRWDELDAGESPRESDVRRRL